MQVGFQGNEVLNNGELVLQFATRVDPAYQHKGKKEIL